MHIEGHVALLTGGASGLGAANVRLLAEHGAKVAISARLSLGAQVPFPSRLGRAAEHAALVRHSIENCC